MAEELEKKEEKSTASMISTIVTQMMRVIASLGFGIIVGAFIYTQGDNALEYILQFIMNEATAPPPAPAVDPDDPFSVGNALAELLTFRMLISVGSGMVGAVWFYQNSVAINKWINTKLGLALNIGFFKKKADLDKE